MLVLVMAHNACRAGLVFPGAILSDAHDLAMAKPTAASFAKRSISWRHEKT